jgi:hypothetical protein
MRQRQGSPILLPSQRQRPSSAIGMDAPAQGAKTGSLTLTLRLRWRLIDAGVEKGAKTGSVTLAHPLRWRLTAAGVEKGAKTSSVTLAHHCDGVSQALALEGSIQPPFILRHR